MQKNNFKSYSILLLILFSINSLQSKKSGFIENFIKGGNDKIGEMNSLRFGTEKLNLEDEKFVNSVIKEMDMTDYDIKLFKMNALGEALLGKKNGITFGSSILFGSEIFNLPKNLQRFVIGHELVHIKQNASLKSIRELYASLITSGVSLYCLKNYIKNKSNINIKNSIANKAVNWITNFGIFVGASQASILTSRYFQRSREFDADCQAAVKLDATNDGIEFLNLLKKDSPIHTQKHMSFYQKSIASHPNADARIERLEKLKNN